MTPVAAYYLFLAEENERAATKATYVARPQGPSLLDRARSLAANLRLKPSTARRPA